MRRHLTYVTGKEDAGVVAVIMRPETPPAWCHATVSQLTSRLATVAATCQHSNEHMVKVLVGDGGKTPEGDRKICRFCQQREGGKKKTPKPSTDSYEQSRLFLKAPTC